MKIYKGSFLTTAILLLSVISCRQDMIEPIVQEENRFLGKKLENPYTLEVMQQAWDNVIGQDQTSGRLGAKVIIEPTHYYVQFRPKNEQEVDLLFNSDTTIYFYSYPLDYELTPESNNYRDKGIPEGEPRYQYAAVPVSYVFPPIKHKILEEAFIPEDVAETNSASVLLTNEIIVNELLHEANILTNNLNVVEIEAPMYIQPDPDDPGSGGGTGCSYCPQGTMKIWDDKENTYVPLVGIKVRARVFLNTQTAITDVTGKYVIQYNFSGTPQYSFEWERYDFTIRDNFLDAAEVVGPKTIGYWSENFIGGTSQFHGTIFRAAHQYFYESINGLRRPPRNSFFGNSIKIKAKNNESDANSGKYCSACRFIGLTTEMWIYNNSTMPGASYLDVYSTTIHELAHASHWAMSPIYYDMAQDILAESWANGVEWSLTSLKYPTFVPAYAQHTNYTGVVRDLIDVKSDYDQVEGYTIRQIEDALNGQSSWTGWRDNIKNKYYNATENNLSSLFSYWD